MDRFELIAKVFELCIFPLLGILTAYLIQIIKVKAAELSTKTDNALLQKYIDMLSTTITNCVIATNQTYVNVLKDEGEFDLEAQKEAFKMVYQQVIKTLQGEAYDYLNSVYTDLDAYITSMIEAQVNQYKYTPMIEVNQNKDTLPEKE